MRPGEPQIKRGRYVTLQKSSVVVTCCKAEQFVAIWQTRMVVLLPQYFQKGWKKQCRHDTYDYKPKPIQLITITTSVYQIEQETSCDITYLVILRSY